MADGMLGRVRCPGHETRLSNCALGGESQPPFDVTPWG
jgi:hypothetical protein